MTHGPAWKYQRSRRRGLTLTPMYQTKLGNRAAVGQAATDRRDRRSRSVWLLLLLIPLAAGLFFRFANLGGKIYWHDEAYTSLRISGHRLSEIKKQIFDGREIGVRELQEYQRLNPEKGLINSVIAQAVDDPQHPPLYYVLARLWARLWGDSAAAIRGLSALISLLAFPCLYWLCRELFGGSPPATYVALALTAVSPFHVLYAQEARQYSLWTVTILLSSAALLRAMRLQKKTWWVVYAASVAVGLYTHTLFALVVIAHGAYVTGSSLGDTALERTRLPKALSSYALATSAGLAAFAPWAAVIVLRNDHLRLTTAWVAAETAPSHLLDWWSLGLSSIFLDMGHDFGGSLTWLVRLPVLILAGHSVYFLCRTAPSRVRLFVMTLIAGTALTLALPDLISGGRRSASPRFLIPCYVGVQLSVAYLLAARIVSPDVSRRRFWRAVTAALILCGIVSCAISSGAQTWWTKGFGLNNLQAAREINRSGGPVVISNSSGVNFGSLLSLSHLLDPKVRLRLVVDPGAPAVPESGDVFLFDPSESMRRDIEREGRYRIEPVHPPELWRFVY